MTAAGAAPVRAVFFDVGETLINETREYGTWADWLGVPRHTLSAMFGAVIARGEDYRQVFQHFRPGFDLAEERRLRLEAGLGEYFNASDLYPDVRGCLATLKERDLLVGIAGNQTARAGQFIRELHLPADVIATSDDGAQRNPPPPSSTSSSPAPAWRPPRSPTSGTASTTTSSPPRTPACSPSGSNGVRGRSPEPMTPKVGARICGSTPWTPCFVRSLVTETRLCGQIHQLQTTPRSSGSAIICRARP